MGSSIAAFCAGYHPKKTPRQGADRKRQKDTPGLDVDRKGREDVHRHGCPDPDQHPDHTSRDADQDRLDEKLCQDVYPLGSDRHAKSYLTRSFSYRNVHDVHDADTSHEQRNTRYGRQQHGHHVGRRGQHRGHLLLRTDRKIVVVGLLQPMVRAQDLP